VGEEMKKNIPLWKKSCIENLRFEDIESNLYEMSEIEYQYGGNERHEDFYVFITDVSARASQLSEQIYEFKYYLADKGDDCPWWDDYCVSLLGGAYNILGYDIEEMDYYSIFKNAFGIGEELAVEEAKKRMERLTKSELIDRWNKFIVILTSYLELKAAYDAVTGALDFLENDGLMKSEELTRDIELAYNRLDFWVDYDGKRKAVTNANYYAYEKILEKNTNSEMWCY